MHALGYHPQIPMECVPKAFPRFFLGKAFNTQATFYLTVESQIWAFPIL